MNTYIIFYQLIDDDDDCLSNKFKQDIEASSKDDALDKFYKLRPNLRPHKITKVAMEWANPQDNIVYLLDEYNTAEVYYINRKFSDSNFTELNIPDTINVKGRKYTVTTIGSRALQGLESLKKFISLRS